MVVDGKGRIFEDRRKKDERRKVKRRAETEKKK